ncbi:hypothetical protein LRP88_05494 [Fusarium phalaenopsidis]
MEDSSQKRMSAIPRLSKLPLPRPTSGIPKPTSALPRPASIIRPSPSRESLGGGSSAIGGELRNPRLRPSMSQNQLRSSIGSSSELRNPRLRSATSREQLNIGTRRTSLISRPPPQAAATRPISARAPSTPRRPTERQPDTIEEQSTTPPYDPPGGAIGVEDDGHIFHRRLTLTRRPSEVFATSPLHDPANNIFDPEQSRPPTASTDDGDRQDTLRATISGRQRSFSSRIELCVGYISKTLFQARKPARLQLRPGRHRILKLQSFSKLLQAAPEHNQRDSAKEILGDLGGQESGFSNVDSGSPWFSLQALIALSCKESKSRQAQHASSKGSLQVIGCTTYQAKGSCDSAEPGTPPSTRKSSAALREQIAKAKAARRAQLKQAAEAQKEDGDQEAPIIPSDTGFDFGVNHDDPFNTRRGEDPRKKVIQNRVNAGRTSGRLNIAALNLKEIPVEVLKMYDLESIGTFDGSWAESVDLKRFIAADNELEELDDFIFPDTNPSSFDEEQASRGNIFAGLENLDMHGNLLVGVPLGLRRLNCLTSLNLSNNRLTNNSIDTIAQVTSLRDLKLANNLFFGPLNSILSNLNQLEILDVHGNNISALPHKVENMSRLRILNLSENSFESLAFDGLATLPITELNLRKNKLSGTLIEEPIGCLPQLQSLDVSTNQLQRLVPLGSAIEFPVLHSLSLSMNRLQGLPDMTSWTSLLTLTVDENNISGIPNSFMSLEKLRHADFSSNDIRVVPPEVSRMENLSMLRLSGNPLRDKKFLSITTDELKDILAGRLEPPPPYQQEAGAQVGVVGILGDNKVAQPQNPEKDMKFDDEDYRSDDDFATPPQSPSRSRSHTVSSRRSRSHTLSNQTWPVKPGGILDRSRTESSSLHPVVSSKVAAENQIRQVFLHNNLFATLPNSLSFFAETLTALSLSHNQLVGEAYLTEDLELPALKELNLSSNHITGLGALTKFLHAPKMEKVDISLNRLNSLPTNLKEVFPALNVLLVANNHIVDLDPDMIRGLKIVDASNNDISHLNPRIGLLGGPGGLERFDVMGNRFRVPRWNVLERGTEATLRWLRGRVPVAEMASWKGDDEEPEAD